MRTVLSLAGALLLAATAFAQDKQVKPAVGNADKQDAGVHRMEIYNGPMRSVHYVYRGLSGSEAQAVRELEMAENEAILARDMLALRQQYVSGERTFDAQRRATQEQLYGFTESSASAAAFSAYRRVGEYGRTWGFFPFGGWGYGDGFSSGATASAFSSADAVSLGMGVGDEGVVKTAMAPIVAGQATPDYAAKANQYLTAATARAAASPLVRDSLKLKAADAAYAGNVVITRVLDGKSEKIEGKVLSEEGDWLILETPQGKRRLMKSTIVDVLEPK
jgi:hypothetical protein